MDRMIRQDATDSPSHGEKPRSKPLTKWKNEPKVEDLRKDLIGAQPHHNHQMNRIDKWLDNLHVKGSAKQPKRAGRSAITPRLIRKQAEWRYAALSEPFLNNESMYSVEPLAHDDRKGAFQNGLIINQQFNTVIDKVELIDTYVRSAVDTGTAILRVGWTYREEDVEIQEAQWDYTPAATIGEANQIQNLMRIAQEDPNGFSLQVPSEMQTAVLKSLNHNQPVFPRHKGYRKKKITRITKNHPTVEVCNHHNVIIDPSCQGDIDKANFVIYSFDTSLSDLEKDGRYTRLDQIQLSKTSLLALPDHHVESGGFNFEDKPRQMFTAHEYWGYWDIDGTGITKPFVATFVGDVMIRMEENPFPDGGIPFVLVQYLPSLFEVYGEPDGALLEENQKVAGAVMRGMIDILGRSSNAQVGSRKDALDPVNKRKFEQGRDFEYNPGVTPQDVFFMHKFEEIPQSAQFMLQLQNFEAEALTGVKAFNQGGISGSAYGGGNASATSVRGALDAASKREFGILRRLTKGLVKVGRKILAMNAEFLSEKEVVRRTGEEFVTVNRDDLAGNFDLKLTVSTAEVDDQKAQELAFMLQTMGNNMDPEMSRMILSDIARLRNMPALAKKIEEYQPQPDPMQQKLQELQMQLLEAQIANEMAQSQYTTARVNTEVANERKIISEADRIDLETIEEESGVNQERELQLIREKSRQDEKIALLKGELDILKERSKPRPTSTNNTNTGKK